jgi:hypothetical protein
VQTKLWIGSKGTNLTIGGNVTNDFLDNLAAHQYQKMHKKKELDLFEVIPKWKEWKESLQGKKRD